MRLKIAAATAVLCLFAAACSSKPVPGPDKQLGGSLAGALSGAGAGAVTGFQVGAGTGPGALVGAGFGAVAGGIQGYAQDRNDDNLLALSARAEHERSVNYAQELLAEQFKRRLEMHPGREIYPADLFFCGDSVKLDQQSERLVKELARMNEQRLPWSTLVVAAYVKASDPESSFARYLAERRSTAIADALIKGGLDARRVSARAVIVSDPVLVDPHDQPERYNQAIELIPLDR